VATVSTLVIAANLVLVGAAPSWLALALALFVAGSLDAVADVANNAHALRVERRYGRSILNSLHAVWSIGAVSGAAMGSLAVGLGVPVVAHLAAVAALLAVVPLAVRRLLLPGADAGDRPPVPPSHAGSRAPSGPRSPRRVHLVASLAALGTVAACAQSVEDVGAAWSALYLRQDLGAAAALGGLGFIALQTCQTVGRLLGDPLVTRFGDRAVARAGAALGGCATAAALATSSPVATVAAFGLVGLGIGTLIPASLRSADELPGLPPGAGLTVVGTIDRIAIVAVPPAIGAVADAAGLRVGLLAMPLAMLLVVLCAGALPHRTGAPVRPAPG
jgi:hypothetical protein